MKITAEQRFWGKVKKTGTCWLWTGAINSKWYGHFFDGQKIVTAHRFAYRLLIGEIRWDRVLDHACNVRSCVRPNKKHVRQLTERANILRGKSCCAKNARKIKCPLGHLLTGENVYRDRGIRIGGRRCRICRNFQQKMRARMAKRVTTLCSCGTRLEPRDPRGARHIDGVWHKVAREARNLRRMGMGYREIARQLSVNPQMVWGNLKREGL